MSSRILVKAVKKAWYDSVDSIYHVHSPFHREDKPEFGTMRNKRQSTLPEHDLTLDETTGWAGVEPVTALRVQGDRPAGEPVPQGSANIGFEEGDSRLPAKIPKNIPADDDPTWNPEVESEWERDPVSGARYYYSRDGQKNFVDLKDAKSGTWATRPTMGDIKNLYTHNDPKKLVGIRGPIDRYGKVHRRDSNQANENLAEAFIEHDENIPPEKLVTVPLGGRMYQIAAEDAGVPNLGYNRRGKGSSRWSDAVPPFNFKHGEPMDIAFQLLKTSVRGTGQDAYDNVYHYPNELNYGAMEGYLQQNPNSTLGDLVSPYLQGQFTNNPSNVTTGPPSYQSERPTQFQSTVAAPFPQTPEQVQGVEDLMEGGFQNYKAGFGRGDNPQKPHYDSMMNAVRVLSGRLRGNPAFNFKPRGFRPGRATNKVAQGRTRNLQNLKMQSMLDTPVTPIMAEMTTAPKQAIPISTGEPMDIAYQLLKAPVMPGRDPYNLDEDEQIWHDEADEDLRAKTNDLMSYLQNLSPEEKLDVTRAQGDAMLNNNLEGAYTCKDGKCGHLPDDEQHKRNLESADQYLLETMMGSWMPDANLSEDAMEGLLYQDMDRAAFPQGQGGDWTAEEGFRAHAVAPEKWRKLSGEPMDIAYQLLKEYNLPEEVFFLSNGRVAFERAWIVLKEQDDSIALQEQAYKLAELNTPWDKKKWPNYDDWMEAIEVEGEAILGNMLQEPEYEHLRELYSQHSEPPENYGELQLPFKERDDLIDFYEGQGVNPISDYSRMRSPSMNEVDGQPQWPIGTLYNDKSGFTTGESMDIAFQLLKERKYHPGHTSEIGMDGDSSLIDEAQRRENAYREAYIDGEYDLGEFGPWWQGPPQTTETLGTQDEDSQFTRNKIPVDTAAIVRRLLGRELPIRVQQARIQDDEGPSFFGMPFNEKTGFTKSLLKERKTPEAWAHKLEYDKKYQKTPKRVKYREQLNAERRKRGIYGKGGADVSHTQGGKLTLESAHANRARHFKNRGTLRRVKVR